MTPFIRYGDPEVSSFSVGGYYVLSFSSDHAYEDKTPRLQYVPILPYIAKWMAFLLPYL